MNITQEKIDDLNAVIKVNVTEADYKEKVDTVLKDYRKKASIPGFRKGHVPMGMVKKMMGTNAMVDEINKILSEALQNYLTTEKLDILGNPLPKLEDQATIDWENQKDFEFRYDVGLAPTFDVAEGDKFKFEHYKIKVDKKDIDKQISDIAKRYGKMSNPEVAEATDMLYGKFEELDGDNPKEGGITNSSVIIIESVTDKKLQKELIGSKPGDIVELDPKKISEHEGDQTAALGITAEELKGLKSNFKYTVEKINRVEPAEINQELFDKVFGPNAVKSEDEFRAKIEEQISMSLVTESDRKLKADIQKEFLDKLKLSLPDSFLKRWIQASNEKPVTPEQIEEEYDQYAQGLKWQLIENKLIEKNEVKVSHEEVVEHTKGLLAQQMASMGMPTNNDEELTETANRVLQNQEEAKNIYMMMYDQKMMDVYKTTFKIKEKEVSYEEFIKIISK
ncbi:MAG: trigger factor [Flavobacteriales bacterium]|nr:trigger factor [Flavobacteriales bacterium]MCB9364675.1 trigger factor [Flavobacteriales bacterium]